jgi:hypothetical protein
VPLGLFYTPGALVPAYPQAYVPPPPHPCTPWGPFYIPWGSYYVPWGSFMPLEALLCSSGLFGMPPPPPLKHVRPLHACAAPSMSMHPGALLMPFGAHLCSLGRLCMPSLKRACPPLSVHASPQTCAPPPHACAP